VELLAYAECIKVKDLVDVEVIEQQINCNNAYQWSRNG